MADLLPARCPKCRQLLMKYEGGAVAPGKWIEIKCRCNALCYIGTLTQAEHAETTPRPDRP